MTNKEKLVESYEKMLNRKKTWCARTEERIASDSQSLADEKKKSLKMEQMLVHIKEDMSEAECAMMLDFAKEVEEGLDY